MPGIFINDGGGTSSALANALSGIAANYSPQVRAQADYLYQQTQGQDIANQDAFEKQRAAEIAAQQTPGISRTFGMNAQDPGAAAPADGTVPNTLTRIAIPPPSAVRGPGGRISRVDESSFNPGQAYLANEIMAGRNPLNTNLPTLYQTAATGPGTDYVTQTELAKQKGLAGIDVAKQTALPYVLEPGQERHVPGGGPTSETITPGPSSYSKAASDAGAAADNAAATKDLEIGANAKADLGRIDLMDQLYDAVDKMGVNDVGSVAWQLLVKKASDTFNMDFSRFSTPAEIKDQIRQLGMGLTGTLRTTQGDPMPRGSLEAIQQMAADPNTTPEQFHRMMQVIRATTQRQAANHDSALKYRTDVRKIGDQAAINYYTERGQNADAEAKSHAGLGFNLNDSAEQPPKAPDSVMRRGFDQNGQPITTAQPPEAAPAPEAKLPAATPQELIFARNAVSRGQSRADVIAHGKAKGFDLEANWILMATDTADPFADMPAPTSAPPPAQGGAHADPFVDMPAPAAAAQPSQSWGDWLQGAREAFLAPNDNPVARLVGRSIIKAGTGALDLAASAFQNFGDPNAPHVDPVVSPAQNPWSAGMKGHAGIRPAVATTPPPVQPSAQTQLPWSAGMRQHAGIRPNVPLPMQVETATSPTSITPPTAAPAPARLPVWTPGGAIVNAAGLEEKPADPTWVHAVSPILPMLIPSGNQISRVQEAAGPFNKIMTAGRSLGGNVIDWAASDAAQEVAHDLGYGPRGEAVAGLGGSSFRPAVSRGLGSMLPMLTGMSKEEAGPIYDANRAIGVTPPLKSVVDPGSALGQLTAGLSAFPLSGTGARGAEKAQTKAIADTANQALQTLAPGTTPVEKAGPESLRDHATDLGNQGRELIEQNESALKNHSDALEGQIGLDRRVDAAPILNTMDDVITDPQSSAKVQQAARNAKESIERSVGADGAISFDALKTERSTFGSIVDNLFQDSSGVRSGKDIVAGKISKIEDSMTGQLQAGADAAGVGREWTQLDGLWKQHGKIKRGLAGTVGTLGDVNSDEEKWAKEVTPDQAASKLAEAVAGKVSTIRNIERGLGPETARQSVAETIAAKGRPASAVAGQGFRPDIFGEQGGKTVNQNTKDWIEQQPGGPEARQKLDAAIAAAKTTGTPRSRTGLERVLGGLGEGGAALSAAIAGLATPGGLALAPLYPLITSATHDPSFIRSAAGRGVTAENLPGLVSQWLTHAALGSQPDPLDPRAVLQTGLGKAVVGAQNAITSAPGTVASVISKYLQQPPAQPPGR